MTTERRAKQSVFSVCYLDYIWVFLIRTVSSSEFLILLLNQSYEWISFDINCGANFVGTIARTMVSTDHSLRSIESYTFLR